MTIINPANLPVTRLPGHGEPCEGRRALLVQLNFTNDGTLTLDLTNLQQQGVVSQIKAMYIDQAGAPNSLKVSFDNSQQTIVAKANTQGFYSVLSPNPTKITFGGAQGTPTLINVFLLNYDKVDAQWATA